MLFPFRPLKASVAVFRSSHRDTHKRSSAILFHRCISSFSFFATSFRRNGDEDPEPEDNTRATANNRRADSPDPPASTEDSRQGGGGHATPRATTRSANRATSRTAEASEQGHTEHPSKEEQRRKAEPEKRPQQNAEARRRRNAEGQKATQQSDGAKEEKQHRKHPQKILVYKKTGKVKGGVYTTCFTLDFVCYTFLTLLLGVFLCVVFLCAVACGVLFFGFVFGSVWSFLGSVSVVCLGALLCLLAVGSWLALASVVACAPPLSAVGFWLGLASVVALALVFVLWLRLCSYT